MAKIVIDARMMRTSTGVYIENLVRQLEKIDSADEYIVLMRKADLDYYRPVNQRFSVVEADFPVYSFSEQIGLARLLYSLKPDLVHFCMPQQPLFYFGKRVTTIHDLTLVRFENVDMNRIVYKIRKAIFTVLLRNVAWRSDAIFTPTEYVRKDLLSFTSKRNAKKVRVTLEAGEPLAAQSEAVEKLIGKKYLFFVGNAFPYKNLRRIVEAYMSLKSSHPELQLVFAGKKDYFYDQIEQFAQEHNVKDVHILGFVSEGEKRWLFQNAQSYVVASLSEGFHIPGLEAMHEGCPVVSSNATCLPEVNGDAALYFDPTSTRELVDAITSVLEDKKLRDSQVERGYKRVKMYSWRRMAEQTRAVYELVLR